MKKHPKPENGAGVWVLCLQKWGTQKSSGVFMLCLQKGKRWAGAVWWFWKAEEKKNCMENLWNVGSLWGKPKRIPLWGLLPNVPLVDLPMDFDMGNHVSLIYIIRKTWCYCCINLNREIYNLWKLHCSWKKLLRSVGIHICVSPQERDAKRCSMSRLGSLASSFNWLSSVCFNSSIQVWMATCNACSSCKALLLL